MAIFIKIIVSLGLIFSLIFVLLPGGFGLMNFKKAHGSPEAQVGAVFFHALWLLHLVVAYNVWAGIVGLWWPVLVLLLLVVVYFATVGKDVSAG